MSPTKLLHSRDHSRRNVLASATTGFTDFLARNGGTAERVLERAGIAHDQFADINHPVDLASYVRMMELAAVDTRNENFGLWFGQQFKPEMLGLIGGIAIASPTLGAALCNVARYFPFHQQATYTAFQQHNELFSLEYRIIDGGIVERRHDAELTLGMLANIFRHCLGAQWAPEQVHFEHPKPAEWRDHAQAFSAPVHFGQRTNALIFRGGTLHQRMPLGDLQRAEFLSNQLVCISGGTGTLSLLDHVKGEIRSRLPGGVPAVETIAAAVSLQRWTLQRRLADYYGLTFLAAVDLVRRELADLHAHRRYVPLSEISDLLGYSELSAFSRAFRRWFGASPQQYRAKLG